MDQELKTYFEGMEARLREHAETVAASTEARLGSHITAESERVETKLLTAFHAWASPTDQKLRTHREAIRALDLEIEAIGTRVAKLEAAQDTVH